VAVSSKPTVNENPNSSSGVMEAVNGIDVWVGNFPSEDLLFEYREDWLWGDPLPSDEVERPMHEFGEPMCQFAVDQGAFDYDKAGICSGYLSDSAASLGKLMTEDELPSTTIERILSTAEKQLPGKPLNCFIALWGGQFEQPRNVSNSLYSLHYLGRFRDDS
jgi:hypothetical protein